jgi:Rrf2 family protein
VLQIPRRVEYALSAVLSLSRASELEWLSFKDIAASNEIPRDYLAKILRSLVDAGIVDSKRGANGGYKLARPAHDVTFLEVIEAADSPVAVNHCTEQGSGSCKQPECAMAVVWQRAEDAMRTVFAATTLGDVARVPMPLTLSTLQSGAVSQDTPGASRGSCPCVEL